MLKDDFVAVAIDQWYQRRQKDAEGDFYRKVASQGPRSDFEKTTQGRYLCTADGKLLAYNNNRGPEKIRELMKTALVKFNAEQNVAADPIDGESQEFDMTPPDGGLILRVHSKVLEGYAAAEAEGWRKVFVDAVGRDNCWLTAEENSELAKTILDSDNGAVEIPGIIAKRIARYHLIDNTRGEPPRWKLSEIKKLEMTLSGGELRGQVHLETSDGKRGFIAELIGQVAQVDGKVSQFDVIAKGEFWGKGPYTGYAPPGRFPLVVAIRIGDGSDVADRIMPHGAKGWIEGYYK